MQLDWNIEEIEALKRRACIHGAGKAVSRHLEHLESHLDHHRNSRSFELRKKLWESVEEWATKLDRLLTPGRAPAPGMASCSLFGFKLWMPDPPKVSGSALCGRRPAPKLELLH